MEKSDYYYRRKELMDGCLDPCTCKIPTMSVVKSELGEDLGNVFLSTCPDPLKPDMGLIPILDGAGDDLWISPSDILIGKVCLKPPFTDKHMKALTHQGILMIGYDIEKKFWNEAELEKQRALEEQEEMLLFMAEMEKRRAVEAARKEEREICKEEKEQMLIEFEERLQFELSELEKRLRKEYERLMLKQKRRLDEEWEDKLEAAVAETTERLTAHFLEEMAKQEAALLRTFEIELKKENIKRKMEVKSIQDCCQSRFMQLKHQMECKNIANIMYVICMERRKCQCEREYFEKKYQRDMIHFQEMIIEKDMEISRLKKEMEESKRLLNLREELLLEILHQFQKFINFALRACPTQAEFLLSIEKMMMFELLDAVCKTDKLHGQRLANKLLKWKSDVKLPIPTMPAAGKSLIAEDFHKCYNEVDTPVTERSEADADYLAAFHYDKHMYVREEFRNMMSQGIKISPSNMLLWNKDVEHLQQMLRRSQTSLAEQMKKEKLEKEKEKAEQEAALAAQPSLSEESELSFHPPKYTKSQQSRRSSVYFKGLDGDGGFLYPSFDSDSSSLIKTQSEIFEEIKPVKDSDTSLIVEGKCCKPCSTPRKKHQVIIQNVGGGFPLLGTKNSLELIHEDISNRKTSVVSAGYSLNQNSVGILCTRDSLLKHRMSLKPISKVLLHRESLAAKEVIALSKPSKSTDLSKKFEVDYDDDEDNESGVRVSKLSLSRNSFFTNKHSIILKNAEKELKSPALSSHRVKKKLSLVTETGSCHLQLNKSGESLKKKIKEISKLSCSKDSLELLRSQSLISKVSLIDCRRKISDQSVEIKNGILAKAHFKDKHSKRVKPRVDILSSMSGDEIYRSIDPNKKPSVCSAFDLNLSIGHDVPAVIYQKKKKPPLPPKETVLEKPRDNFITKPNEAHIGGDKARDHLLPSDVFGVYRANSLINIFRKHPSLIKIFTPCTK